MIDKFNIISIFVILIYDFDKHLILIFIAFINILEKVKNIDRFKNNIGQVAFCHI